MIAVTTYSGPKMPTPQNSETVKFVLASKTNQAFNNSHTRIRCALVTCLVRITSSHDKSKSKEP